MEGEYYDNSNFEGSTSKKNKHHDQKGNLLQISLDRISDLPDSLLIQILSFLETKDAFKTSVLSKRWKNVWTQVQKLEFNCVLDESKGHENLHKFVSFVDHTLLNHTSHNLKHFSLFSGFEFLTNVNEFVHDAINKWLQCISKKNVENFRIVMMPSVYCAPEWFYHNPSFVNLLIYDWTIKILGSAVFWPSLKILKLYYVKIDDEQIAKILLGCPVLETISFSRIVSVTHLNIMSRSVKKLKIYQGRPSADLLDLNAPWLQEIEIYGSFTSGIPRMINVSSLIAATFMLHKFEQHFDDDEDLLLDMAYKLLESLHHVKKLRVTVLFIQALSIAKHTGRLFPLFMCKHLTLHLSLLKYELLGMACILQRSPHLENLVILMDIFSECHFPKIFAELLDMDLSLISPSENALHPKNVEIIYFKDLCFVLMLQKFDESKDETLPEIILAEYLFKNAPFMGKLVISTRLGNCKECTKNCASRYLSILSSRFFSLWVKRDDNSDWQVRKKGSTLEISRM